MGWFDENLKTAIAFGSKRDAVGALASDEHGKGSGVSDNAASTGENVVLAAHAIIIFHLLPDSLNGGGLREVESDPVARDNNDDNRKSFKLFDRAELEE